MPARRSVIVLVGPTAVGKTELSLSLAEALDTEIVVADSRQVYRGMDIGTSKPTKAERRRVAHHLMDVAEPAEVYSAGRYQRAAIRAIKNIAARGRLPMLVGGTGLYVRAVIYGLWRGPRADWALRRRLEAESRRGGAGALHRRLMRVDPESAARLHPNDMRRIIRALEVYRLTGVPLSAHHARHGFRSRRYRPLVIGFRRDRQDLARRIEQRVDRMIEDGWVEEVERLLSSGVARDSPGMQGIGYRQIAGMLEGRSSLEETVARIKRETRRYAKRQMTWFRVDPAVVWVDLEPGRAAKSVKERILRRIRLFLMETGIGAPRRSFAKKRGM